MNVGWLRLGLLVAVVLTGCSKENAIDASQNTECGDNSLDCVPCEPGEYVCDDATLKECQTDGQGYDAISVCASEALCVKGLPQRACAEPACSSADSKCDGVTMKVCSPGQDELVETDCPSVASCTAGLKDGKCAAGECSIPTDCTGVDTECRKRTCVAGKCDFEDLPEGESCSNTGTCDGAGNCLLCTKGERRCKDENTAQVCDDTWNDEPCDGLMSRCDHGSCVGGATLVWVPAPGGESYGIDSTEVTRTQYQEWLSTNPSTSGQPSYCAWNDDFIPTPGTFGGDCGWPPTTKGSHPVDCVDWCDAYAYCEAVGKRLCGKIGGGSNPYTAYQYANSSQWYAVCTSGGVYKYPYGDTYEPSKCNGQEANLGGTVPVASMQQCQPNGVGYQGVYDLSGNAFEWEDSCTANFGNGDFCRLRGGNADWPEYHQSCGSESYTPASRADRFQGVGFRCCSL